MQSLCHPEFISGFVETRNAFEVLSVNVIDTESSSAWDKECGITVLFKVVIANC